MNSFGPVKDIELRDDGKCIGILYSNGSFKLFKRYTQSTPIWNLTDSRNDTYNTFSVSEDGNTYAIANETCVQIYQNGKVGKEECLPSQKIVEITLSPKGGMLAVLVEYKGAEGDIYRFNVTRSDIIRLPGDLRSIPFIDATMYITDSGAQIVTHSAYDNVVRFHEWELKKWKLLDQKVPSQRMYMSSDNTALVTTFSEQDAVSGSSGLVRVYHQDSPCERGMSEMRLTFVCDNNPDELSWEIVKMTRLEEIILLSNNGHSNPKGSMVVDKLCIPNKYLEETVDQVSLDSCILLQIYDLGSDGLRKPGMVGVSVNGEVRWNTSTTNGYFDRFPLFGNMTCLGNYLEPSYRSTKFDVSWHNDCLSFDCSWKLIGQIFKGYVADYFHYGLSLSADGSIIAVSNVRQPYEVRVFEINHKGEWIQRGLTLNSTLGRFGNSLSLSSDGSILAVGATYSDISGHNSGTVQIFGYKSAVNKWEQIGNSINGWGTRIEFGEFLRLSSEGTILAATTGVWEYKKCAVGIYAYNSETDEWIRRGRCLKKYSNDILNHKIALSKTGSIIAYAFPKAKVNGEIRGVVRVFKFNEKEDDWELLGNIIEGFGEFHLIGISLSISGNGFLLAVGGWYSFGATVFEYNEDLREWKIKGQGQIKAEGDNDYVQVVISSDGYHLVVRNGINTYIYEFIPEIGLWVRSDRQIITEETTFRTPQVVASSDTTIIATQDKSYVNIYQLQAANSSCPESQDQFSLTILPDQFPEDIVWFLYNQDGKLLRNGVLRSTDTGTEVTYDKCLSKNDTAFMFGIEDRYGDGLCCDWGAGNFTVRVNNQIILNSDGFDKMKLVCFPESNNLTTIKVELDMRHRHNADMSHWYLMNADSKVVFMEAYGDIFYHDKSNQNVRCVPLDGCYVFRVHDYSRGGLSGGVMFNDEMVTQFSIDDEFFFHESLIGNCNNTIKSCPDGTKSLEINFGLDCDTVQLYWYLVDSKNNILLSEYADEYTKNYQFYKVDECLSEPINECVTIGVLDTRDNGSVNFEIIWDGELVESSRSKGTLEKVSFGNCTSCPEGQQLFELAFRTDDYPEEFSWELRSSSEELLLSGGNYPDDPENHYRFYYIRECVPVSIDECVLLYLIDSWEDGGTAYEAWWNGRLLEDREQTNYYDTVELGDCRSCSQNETLFELDIYVHSYYPTYLKWDIYDSNNNRLAGLQYSYGERNRYYTHWRCFSVSPNECLTLRIENGLGGYMGTKHSVWWNGTLIENSFQNEYTYEVVMGNCTAL